MVNSPLPSELHSHACVLAGLAGQHVDLVGHHERRIEADPELADQRHVLLRVAGELGGEVLGAGPRDGAQRIHQVLAVEADAVIDNAEGLGVLVDDEADLEIGIAGNQVRFGQRQIAQAVARVGGVGYELAEEDFLVGVERVGNDVEQLADFGLKCERLLRHGVASSPVGV